VTDSENSPGQAREAPLSAPVSSIAPTPRRRLTTLAAMLFLEHAILGAWVPLLQLHLRALGFSGTQIGSIYATLAVASIIAPWLGGQLADRVIPAQWVMLVSHLCGAVLLWWTAASTRYETILALLFCNAIVYMPTLALSNLIVFRHLADSERQFGYVRLWGTLSWVVVAGALGLWLSRPSWLPGAQQAQMVDSVRLAAILSVILSLFCLALPPTPPEKAGASARLAALGALRTLRDRSGIVLIVVSFFLALEMPFVYPFASLFLQSLGVSEAHVSPLLALSQVGEIVAFLLLAGAIRRLGFKTTFLIGVASWMIRFTIWSIGGPWPLIVLSLPLHGCCYAFVIGLGQIFVDQRSAPDTRASAQALHQVLTFGVGMWIGNLVGGTALDLFQFELPDGSPAVDFTQFYLWPALLAALCLVVFAALFKTPTRREAALPEPPDLPM
jgi:nucleoside transporter